jgi:hypothetical protein
MEVRSWAKVAARARSRAPLLKYGTTDDGLRQVAGELGVKWSAHTMRRAMSALAATERLESEAAIPAVELQRFPMAAVEYADRLYRRDPAKGKAEISKLIGGEITVAALKRQEEEGHAPDREAGKSLKTRFRRSVQPAIEAAISKALSDHVMPNARTSEIKKGLRKNVEDPLAIADFVSTDQKPEISIPPYGPFTRVRLAAMMVGPYTDKSNYRTRSFDWAAKARALLEVYGRVILVLPPDCPAEPFIFWRAMFRQPDNSLLLLKLLAGGKSEFLDDHFSGRRRQG